MTTKIDLTGVSLVKLVQQAYALSRPKGLGRLNYEPDVLTDADAQALIDRGATPYVAVSLDYVKGRAVKLIVRRDGDRLSMDNAWYDHTNEQPATLLACVGQPDAPEVVPHNSSCECSVCDLQRRRARINHL